MSTASSTQMYTREDIEKFLTELRSRVENKKYLSDFTTHRSAPNEWKQYILNMKYTSVSGVPSFTVCLQILGKRALQKFLIMPINSVQQIRSTTGDTHYEILIRDIKDNRTSEFETAPTLLGLFNKLQSACKLYNSVWIKDRDNTRFIVERDDILVKDWNKLMDRFHSILKVEALGAKRPAPSYDLETNYFYTHYFTIADKMLQEGNSFVDIRNHFQLNNYVKISGAPYKREDIQLFCWLGRDIKSYQAALAATTVSVIVTPPITPKVTTKMMTYTELKDHAERQSSQISDLTKVIRRLKGDLELLQSEVAQQAAAVVDETTAAKWKAQSKEVEDLINSYR